MNVIKLEKLDVSDAAVDAEMGNEWAMCYLCELIHRRRMNNRFNSIFQKERITWWIHACFVSCGQTPRRFATLLLPAF